MDVSATKESLVVVTGAACFEGAFIALEAADSGLPVLALSADDFSQWKPDVLTHSHINFGSGNFRDSSFINFAIARANRLCKPDTSVYVIACPDPIGPTQLGVTSLFQTFQKRFGERVHCAVVYAEQTPEEAMWVPEFQVSVPHVEARLRTVTEIYGDRLKGPSLAHIFL